MKKYIKPSIDKVAVKTTYIMTTSIKTSDEEVDTSNGGIQLGNKKHYNDWNNIWK